MTPPLDLKADAMVNAVVSFSANWQGFADPSTDLLKQSVFAFMINFEDRRGAHSTYGGPRAVDLGRVDEILAPKKTGERGLYVVETSKPQKFAHLGTLVEAPTSDLVASVCYTMPGVGLTIHSVDLEVKYDAASGRRGDLSSTKGGKPSLILCEPTGLDLATACMVESTEIHATPTYETDVTLSYRFNCLGAEALRVALVDASGRLAPLLASRGEINRTTLTTRGAVILQSTDPVAAYASFVGVSCNLEIVRIETQPSAQTIESWEQEQAYLIDVISDKHYLWKLAGQIETISEWDADHVMALRSLMEERLDSLLKPFGVSYSKCFGTGGKSPINLPAEWFTAIDARPEIADQYLMIQYLDDLLNNRPRAVGIHQIERAAASLKVSLTGFCREELIKKCRAADALLKRFDDVGIAARQELTDALAEIESLLSTGESPDLSGETP